MDQFATRECKVENENYSYIFQSESYIKEEIIIPDVTEYFDDDTLNTVKNLEKMDKNEIKFTHKEQNCNQGYTHSVRDVDEYNEKLFTEMYKNKNISEMKVPNSIEANNIDSNATKTDQCVIKLEVDVTSDQESLLLNATDHSDERENDYKIYTPKRTRETGYLLVTSGDKDKETITTDKSKCENSRGPITMYNFFKKPSRTSIKSSITSNTPKAVVHKDVPKTMSKVIENKGGKLESVIHVCLKCTKKDKILSARRRINCQECNEPMNYECLTCGNRMKSIAATYYHIENICGQKKTCQCEHCSYQGKSEYLLRCHITKQHDNEMECPKCHKKFNRKIIMLKHKEGCGISMHFLRCKFCPFDTKYKESIVRHMRKAHKNVQMHQCADIIKNIIEEGEKIKANTIKSADGKEANTMSRTIDGKRFIQLYCIRCDEICENANYRNERNCRKCGAATLLQCIKCAKRYSKMQSMYGHLRLKCAAQNRYQCVDCDYFSTNKPNLANHIVRRHTVVPREYYERCRKCDRRYKIRRDRMYHEKRCGRDMLQCHLCPFKDKNKGYFNLHMQDHMLHENTVNAMADGARISATVNNRKLMSTKEELKVENLTNTFCPKCDESIKYVKHKRRMCSKCRSKLSYQCGTCVKVYSLVYDLRVHIIDNHLSPKLKKQQQCLSCGKRFTLYKNLQMHEKLCNKQLNMHCTYCHFRTKYRSSIIQHLRMKHSEVNGPPKRFICVQCDKGYSSVYSLKFHKRYYCGKQPSFGCNHCSFKAYTKSSVLIHLKAVHKHLYCSVK